MASIIRIKRSGSATGAPSSLAQGEMAYTWTNNVERLYIGTGTEALGAAANIEVVGGAYYTGLVDASTAGLLTTSESSIPVLSATGTIDKWLVGNLQLTGNTLSSTDTNGVINITPNGAGKIIATNLYIGDSSTSLQEYIEDISGGSVTGGVGLTSTYDDGLGTSTINLDDTTVTPGSYGSATQIPTFTVDQQGRLTAAGTANVATQLTISDGTTPDTVDLLTDTLTIAGSGAINTAVTDNTVTVSVATATTSVLGVASFDTNNFTVTAGAVSAKDITIGSTALTLGQTTTVLDGLLQLNVDNIRIDGNEISSTDINGTISLNPNGTGHVSVNNANIENLADPVNAQDAATKNYVDNSVTGLHWKQAVNLLADSNIALTGTAGTFTIDGHPVLDAADNGYRILLVGQTTDAENGIYTYTDNGATYTLARSTDADTFNELEGASVWVLEGTVYGSTGWVQENYSLSDFTLQDWVQFSGAGAFTAGDGLGQTGTEFFIQVANLGGLEISSDELQLKSSIAGAGTTYSNGVIDIVGTADRLAVSADSIDIASTYVGQTSLTTLGTVTTGTWNADVIQDAYVADDLTISAGTIDNTPIGATTRSTGAFTTLAANSAVSFTSTLGVTGNVTVGSDLIGSGTSNLNGFNIDGGTY